MDIHNIFSSLPDDLDNEVFETLLNSSPVKIERIVSKGHKSPESGWYDQEQNEWVMVLRGEAVLAFDDRTSVRLREGDFLNIPSHKKHRVEWTAPDRETIWLAVHYR